MNSAKNPQVRLAHNLQQIDVVAMAVQDLNPTQARNNVILNLAIERSVQIVSEAAKELPPELRNRYQDVHWQATIGIWQSVAARVLPDQSGRHLGYRDCPLSGIAAGRRANGR